MNRAAALRRRTAPGLLVERARSEPDGIACRVKRRGVYEERTWRALAARVAAVARGLEAIGLRAGDRLAIMGDACEDWVVADLACQSLGGITYGIYPTASIAELEYQMADGGATVFVAEDQEYVDKILAVAARLPALRRIVVVDATALFMLDDPRVLTLDALVACGEAAGTASATAGAVPTAPTDLAAATAGTATTPALDWLAARAARVDPDDPAFIVYTSGTTGHPKGALVAHGRHLAGTSNLIAHYPSLARPGGRTVVYLPLCHVLGRDVAITLPLLGGPVPHFGESVEDLPATLFEIAPTVLFTVPRYLQKFASQVLTGVANATPLKRRVFDRALAIGRRYAQARWDGRPSIPLALGYALARAVAFRPVLNKLGLDRIALLVSGGAPLATETATFWQMLGLNVCEIYGQTETAGAIISGQKGPFPRPGDVGTPAEGIALRLAPEAAAQGEIRIRSDYRFEGYWGLPEATAALFDGDWLASGDVGRFDGDRLRLVDRARDFIVTAGGKTLSPSHIENAVRGSPYIAEVVVIGHARRFVSALIEIDADAVSDWAQAQGVSHAGFTDLTLQPAVRALIQAEIDKANATLARVEQIKRFAILPKALDPEEEGEPVTPTRKIKRRQMSERYASLVEAMYGEEEEALLQRAISR